MLTALLGLVLAVAVYHKSHEDFSQFAEELRKSSDLAIEEEDSNAEHVRVVSSEQSSTSPKLSHDSQKTVVIGVSTGRSGTLALATLLDSQPHTTVTHEARKCKSIPWNQSEEDPETKKRIIWGRIKRYLSSPGSQVVGDVASWALPYLPYFFEIYDNVKVVATKRKKEDCVRSWVSWLGKHNQFLWLDVDRVARTNFTYHEKYVECFPHYDWSSELSDLGGLTVEMGASRYYDDYYRILEGYMERWPDKIRLYDTYEILNDRDMQVEMLSWLGEAGPYNFEFETSSKHNTNNELRDSLEEKFG